jgi:hypothetical protein
MARSAPYSRAATGRWRSLPPIDVEHIIARRPERGRPDLADEHGGPRLLGGQVSYEMPAAAARGAGSRWWVLPWATVFACAVCVVELPSPQPPARVVRSKAGKCFLENIGSFGFM